MLCKSNSDLSEYGKRLTDTTGRNFLTILEYHFQQSNAENIWIIEKISDYCDAPYGKKNHIHHLLESLYDVSETMVLWYSDFYTDLDIVETKEDLINLIEREFHDSHPLELYILAKNEIQGRVF